MIKSKDKLVEIKKGEHGTGLLIESDGFVSPEVGDNKKLFEDINRMNEEGNGKFHCPSPFIVSAVFQKFGIQNANGRIYPESILKREVEKYQELIKDHRAIGECYKPSAMVLTETGWKQISEVNGGEHVLTLNTETNNIELQPILNVIEKDYDGEMSHIKGNSIDECVTPEHGFPVYQDGHFMVFAKAQTLSRMTSDFINEVIPNELHYQSKDGEYKFDFNTDSIGVDLKDVKFETEQYNGKVYCIEVPNHTWYVMENGKCHWTKNCNHPAESVIDLSRVAMNITELHWEGRTLVGKLEVLITEGFRKHGIVSTCGDEVANLLLHGVKIGVSSRGLGTVEQRMGALIVGDDFELVCWDFVSSPSTFSAFVGLSDKEIQPYIESTENNGKPVVNENISKIEEILSDF